MPIFLIIFALVVLGCQSPATRSNFLTKNDIISLPLKNEPEGLTKAEILEALGGPKHSYYKWGKEIWIYRLKDSNDQRAKLTFVGGRTQKVETYYVTQKNLVPINENLLAADRDELHAQIQKEWDEYNSGANP